MVDINYYELKTVENHRLKYAIIMARYKNKWILVRNKDRSTWEIPAGHREKGEDISITASRELMEETGAVDFNITPLFIYSLEGEEIKTYGQLFLAQVESLGKLPDYEIAEIKLFNQMPENITYPQVQPHFFEKIEEIYKQLEDKKLEYKKLKDKKLKDKKLKD